MLKCIVKTIHEVNQYYNETNYNTVVAFHNEYPFKIIRRCMDNHTSEQCNHRKSMGERSEFIGTKDVIEELMINALFRTIVSEARSANLLVLLSISYSLCPRV